MWIVVAVLSAVFAGITAILSKCGIKNVNSNVATAIRMCVVFVLAWLIVVCRNELKFVKDLKCNEIVFLVLSGIATCASWICCYYAIKQGQVSVVVPVDKLSILFTVFFSLIAFKEKLSLKAWIGLTLLVTGTVLMAVLHNIE